MKIISQNISLQELNQLAGEFYGDMVKAVVDVDRGIIAVNAELHADLEACLLAEGSKQNNLWGINLYPKVAGDGFIEFDSMINVRPNQGNRSRDVQDKVVREKIIQIVGERVSR